MPKNLIAQRGDEILDRLPRNHFVIGAEVGVFDGRLSGYLLRENRSMTLLLVDRWSAVPMDHPYWKSGSEMARHTPDEWTAIEAKARSAVAFAANRAIALKGESVQVAAMIWDGSLDFSFIDAEHTYEAVTADLQAWWPKIRSGGFIAGHDWDHPEDHIHPDGSTNRMWGVKKAVEDFFKVEKLELGMNRTWIVWKERPI